MFAPSGYRCRTGNWTTSLRHSRRATRHRQTPHVELLETRVLLECTPDSLVVEPGQYHHDGAAWILNRRDSTASVKFCGELNEAGEPALRIRLVADEAYYFLDTNAALSGIEVDPQFANVLIEVSIGQTLDLEGSMPVPGVVPANELAVSPVGYDAGNIVLDVPNGSLRLRVPGDLNSARAAEFSAEIDGVVRSGVEVGQGGGSIVVAGPVHGGVRIAGGGLTLSAGGVYGPVHVAEGSLSLSTSGDLEGDIDVEQGDAEIEVAGSVFGSIAVNGRLQLAVAGHLESDGIFAGELAGVRAAAGRAGAIVATRSITGDVRGLDSIDLIEVQNGSIASANPEVTLTIEANDGIGRILVARRDDNLQPVWVRAHVIADADGDHAGDLGLLLADRFDGTIQGHHIGTVRVGGGTLVRLDATGDVSDLGTFDSVGSLHVAGNFVGVWVLGTGCTAGDPSIRCAPRPEICGDGVDNDGDGAVDENCLPGGGGGGGGGGGDPPPEICNDGLDNDHDGWIDEFCEPPPDEICGDQIDNNQNGLIDEGCTPLQPDLVPIEVSLDRTSLAWNELVTIRHRVRNQGQADADPSRVGYYLSLDADIDPEVDYRVHTFGIGAVAAGQTIPAVGQFDVLVQLPPTPPQGFPQTGVIFIGLYVDDQFVIVESNEGNNDQSIAVTLVALPDLTPVEVSLNKNTVEWSRTIRIRHRVKNQGSADADPSRVGYYLSLDAELDPVQDFRLGTRHIGSVRAGETIPSPGRFEILVTLPAEPPPGFEFANTIYIGPYVDDEFVVGESDEANNDAAVPVTVRYSDNRPRLVWFRLVEDTGRYVGDLYTSKSPTEGRIANLQPHTQVRYEYYNRDSRERVAGTVDPDSTGYFQIPLQLATFDPVFDTVTAKAELFRNNQRVPGTVRSFTFSLDTIEPRVRSWQPSNGTISYERLATASATLDEEGYLYGLVAGSPPSASVADAKVIFDFRPPLANGQHLICVAPDVGDRAGNRITRSCMNVTVIVPEYAIAIHGPDPVLEPDGPARFTIALDPPVAPGDRVTVSYKTQDGTAKSTQDYYATAGSVLLQPGESAKTFDVAINNDLIPEPVESFLGRITAVQTLLGDWTLWPWEASATIVDDDCFRIYLERDVSVSESAGTARFAVRVDPAPGPSQAVEVDVSTSDGTATHDPDYEGKSERLHFGPGESWKPFDVTIHEDELVEADEFFYVNLSNETAYEEGVVLCTMITDGQAVGTITDNDSFEVYLVRDVEVEEGETAVFEVRVEPVPGADQEVFVEFFTTDGSAVSPPDYMEVWVSLVFGPGVNSQFVPVPTVDDALVESTEIFYANLDNAYAIVAGQSRAVTITNPQVRGIIHDNDQPPDYSVAISDCAAVVESGGPAMVSVTVTPPVISGDVVTVGFTTANGTAMAGQDYLAVSDTIQFHPGASSHSIAIPIVNDLIPEPDEYFKALISHARSSLGTVTITRSRADCHILDDDQFEVYLVRDVTIPESQSPAQFEVRVYPTPGPGQVVYVDVFTLDRSATGTFNPATVPGDYVHVTQTLVFSAGSSSRLVNVPILDDLLVESDEDFLVMLGNAASIVNGQIRSVRVTKPQVVGTIIDDDVYTITVNDVIVRETDCNCADFVIQVRPPVVHQSIVVEYEILDVTATYELDYFTTDDRSGFIRFSDGHSVDTVDLYVVDDHLLEGTEYFKIVLSNAYMNIPNRSAPALIIAKGTGVGTILDVEVSLALEEQHEPHRGPIHDSAAPGSTIQTDLLTGSPGQAVFLPDGEILIHSGRHATGEWLVHARARIETVAAPATTEFKLVITRGEGDEVEFEPVYYETGGLGQGSEFRVAIPFDATEFETGRYDYRIEVRTSPCSDRFSYDDRLNVVNDSRSAVGAGWYLSPAERIYPVDDGAILQFGDGTIRYFPGDGSGYDHADGNFSTLERRNDGSFVRTLPDQTTLMYDAQGMLRSVVLTNGRITTYFYEDVNGDSIAAELTGVVHPTGRGTTYQYTGDYLSVITDFAGRETRLEHDGHGNIIAIRLPDDSVWRYFYDDLTSRRRLTRLQNAKHEEHLTYDETGRVERRAVTSHTGAVLHAEEYVSVETRMLPPPGTGTPGFPAPPLVVVDSNDPGVNTEYAEDSRADATGAMGTTRLTFDRFSQLRGSLRAGVRQLFDRDDDGLLIKHINPLGRTTHHDYDVHGNRTTTTYPDGSTITAEFDPQFNLVTQRTDENGQATTFQYNNLGQLERIVDALGYSSLYLYDARGNLQFMRDPAGHWTGFTYDLFDRLTTQTRPDGTTVTLEYDIADNVAVVTDERGFSTISGHDEMNRLRIVVDPLQRVSLFVFDSMGNMTAAVDPSFAALEYSYDDLNRLVEVIGPLGRIAAYTYNPAHRVSTQTTGTDSVTNYLYDSLGRLTAENRPEGYQLRYEYDVAGRLIAATDPITGVRSFRYDDRDRIIRQTDAQGNSIVLSYYPAGQLLAETDALGRTTTHHIDALGRDVRLVFPDNTQETYQYDAVGNLDVFTDSSGRPTDYDYDSMGRVVRARSALHTIGQWTYVAGLLDSERDANGHITRFSYDAARQLQTVTSPSGLLTRYEYDLAGRVQSITDSLSRTTTFQYDLEGHLIARTDPAGGVTRYSVDAHRRTSSMTNAIGGVTTYRYDALDRMVSVTDPAGIVTNYVYDLANRRTTVTTGGVQTAEYFDSVGRNWLSVDGAGGRTVRLFDAAGQVTRETDPNGNATQYVYDSRGRVAQIIDARGGRTSIEYDGAGRRSRVTDAAGNATRYTYDTAGRLIQEQDPLGLSTSYTYDPAGRLTAIRDRRGWLRYFDYDSEGRLVAERWDTAGTLVRSMSFGYDMAGQLVSAADPDASYTFAYDMAGRVTNTAAGASPLLPQVSMFYAYDAAGNRTSQRDSMGGVVDITLDPAHRPTQMIQSGPGITGKQISFSYNTLGQFSSIRRHQASAFITQANYTYDAAGRLQQLRHNNSFGTLQASYTLGYDAGSRIAALTMTSSAAGTRSGGFVYDSTNQLTAVTGTLDRELYSYDLAGNRLTSQSGSAQNAYLTSASNRLISDGQYNYSYDAEGNVIRKVRIADGQVTDFQWDHRNRLVSVEERTAASVVMVQARYTYDLFDRRIAKQTKVPTLQSGPATDNIGLFVVSTLDWQLDLDGAGGNPEQTIRFRPYGTVTNDPNNVPVTGDWDGDGKDEIGIYLRSAGDWYLDSSLSGGQAENVLWYQTDYNATPVVGDWNSDGRDDVGVFNRVTLAWQLETNGQNIGYDTVRTFGGIAAANVVRIPIVGDWDGDGDDNFGIYDPQTGTWYLDTDGMGGAAERTIVTGQSGSGLMPVAGDWDGDGDDNIGVYDGVRGVWLLDTDWNPSAWEQKVVMGGGANYLPVVGDWDGPSLSIVFSESREAYIYDGDQIVMEFRETDDNTLAQSTRRVYGPLTDQILAEEQYFGAQPSQVLWPLSDWQGSVRDIVQLNASAAQSNVVKHLEYDTFGRLTRVTTGTGLPSSLESQPNSRLGYTGREYDRETGLQYHRARYYQPAVGRWMSEDPIGFAAGDSNLHRYVGNNAVNRTDVTGLFEEEVQLRPVSLDQLQSSVGRVAQARAGYSDTIGIARSFADDPVGFALGGSLALRAFANSVLDTASGGQYQSLKAALQQSVAYVDAGAAMVEQAHSLSRSARSRDWSRFASEYVAFNMVAGGGSGLDQVFPLLPVGAALSGHTSSVSAAAGVIHREAAGRGERAQPLIMDLAGAAVGGLTGPARGQMSALRGTSRSSLVGAGWDSEYSLSVAARGEPFAFGTGSRSERAEALLHEAARASGYNNAFELVDEILYNPREISPYFWVTETGVRRIVIDPGTFGKTRAGQLIVGAHELVHAEHFMEILVDMGNLKKARKAFFVPYFTHRYQIREMLTEPLAESRVATHLGGLTPQQVGHSTRYVARFARDLGIPLPLRAGDHAHDVTDNGAAFGNLTLDSEILVTVADGPIAVTLEQRERIADAVALLGKILLPLGASITIQDSDAGAADFVIRMAAASPCGDSTDGILGCTFGNTITILSHWDWYSGGDESQIGPQQFDFQTMIMHELGHALGLAHSDDPNSAMYPTLPRGHTRRVMELEEPGEAHAESLHSTHQVDFGTDHDEHYVSEGHLAGCKCNHCFAKQTQSDRVGVNSEITNGAQTANGVYLESGGRWSTSRHGESKELVVFAGRGSENILIGGDGSSLRIAEPGRDALIGGIGVESDCEWTQPRECDGQVSDTPRLNSEIYDNLLGGFRAESGRLIDHLNGPGDRLLHHTEPGIQATLV